MPVAKPRERHDGDGDGLLYGRRPRRQDIITLQILVATAFIAANIKGAMANGHRW